MIKSMLSADEKFGSFKKNCGPPNYQFNPRYNPLEHNDYLQKHGVSLSEVKQFEPKVRIAHDPHHH